jgi:hypothetical protein
MRRETARRVIDGDGGLLEWGLRRYKYTQKGGSYSMCIVEVNAVSDLCSEF